jgi:hypothetical protein
MPDNDDIPRRRRVLVLDITQAAAKVSDLIHEARAVNLPIEPGVREGRDALVRWAVLLEELLPNRGASRGRMSQRPPREASGAAGVSAGSAA